MRNTLVLLLGLVLAACGGSSGETNRVTGPSTVTGDVPFGTTDLRAGTGAQAQTGNAVTVHYTGWLYSQTAADNKGQQFDSSVGRPPLDFVIGAGRLIRGFEQGVVGMRVGGLRRVVIPPDLGYGSTGNGPIPPNATLIFEIELLSVR
jgi:FKBP-type peptidyl-prolyl cis-trans isomerase FkpA